ncbi:MAG: SCO family protein, partial [Cryomorphaceae bacterium]
MQRRNKLSLLLGAALLLSSCSEEAAKELPILGPYKVTDNVVDGVLVTDTAFTSVRPFSFVDQSGNEVSHSTIEGKLFVTDFFFTSCPTICPKMKQQMLRVYDAFEGEPDLVLLSHSIDPIRDSVGRLKDYADKLGIASDRWHMVTGNRDSIYSMAKHYMIAAQVDELAPGGYAHSG